MTLIAAIGFLDESYLISDSRVSYSVQKQPEDKLIKVYQIAPRMMVAFTSEHVDFTLEVLRRITAFSLKNVDSKKSRFILPYLIRLASFEYRQLVKEVGMTKPPHMEFIYCGVINKQQMFSSYLLDEIIRKKGGSFSVPEKIGRAMMNRLEGVWALDPPSPILYRQTFPENPSHPYIYLGYVTGGSGRDVFYEIERSYYKFFDWDLGTTKGIIFENIVDDYIKKNSIPSIGGIVQVWRINKNGITPISYTRKKTNADNQEKVLRELRFTGSEWVSVDHVSGQKSEAGPIQYFLPSNRVKVRESSWSNY